MLIEEGLKVVLLRLAPIVIGFLILVFRKPWAKASAENMKSKSLARYKRRRYSEEAFLTHYLFAGIFSISLGVVTLLPLLDSTPNEINQGVVDFIRNYMVIPVLGGEVLFFIVYFEWRFRDKD